MDHLQTEGRNPASMNLDELSPLEIVRLMNAEDAKVIPAVAAQAEAIARAITAIAERLAAGGRLIYAGAGTSGRLGVLDATECPPTFNAAPGQVIGIIAGGTPALTQAVEGAEDHPEFAELAGFSLTTAVILYRLPDYPSLLQTYVWQDYDLHPRFPRLRQFLEFWSRNLDGKLFRVTVAHRRLIAPAVWRAGRVESSFH